MVKYLYMCCVIVKTDANRHVITNHQVKQKAKQKAKQKGGLTMKKRLFSFLLCLAVVFSIIGVIVPTEAEAASVKLNKKKVTIYEGDTYELKLKKATGDIVWKTSKKSVATVKDGIVTAKKAGKATISAVYNDKTYKCKVTVKKRETVENESSSDPVANETVETPTPTPEPRLIVSEDGPTEEQLRLLFPTFPDAKPADGGKYVWNRQIAASRGYLHHAWIALSDVSIAKMGYRLCDTNPNLIETVADDYKTTSNRQSVMIGFYGYHERTENNALNPNDCEKFETNWPDSEYNHYILSETTTLNMSGRAIYTILFWSDFSYVTDYYNKLTLDVVALIPVGDVYYCTMQVTVPYGRNEDYKNAYKKALKMIDNLVSYAVIVED